MVVKAEIVAMRLAAVAGRSVAEVDLKRAVGNDVLLLKRLDREQRGGALRSIGPRHSGRNGWNHQ